MYVFKQLVIILVELHVITKFGTRVDIKLKLERKKIMPCKLFQLPEAIAS
jgi:hypothetical protein